MTRRLVVFVLLVFCSGCGNIRTTPHLDVDTAGLPATVEDKDAGLVGLATGFDLRRNKTVVVERFTVTDPGIADSEDKELAVMAPAYLQAEFVRRLKGSGLFEQVVMAGEPVTVIGPVLKLTGTLAQVQGGSRHLRFWIGFGAGRTKVEIHSKLSDGATGQSEVVTAVRRVAAISEALSLDYGGSNEDLVRDALRDSARDYARFLVRLARGEAPSGGVIDAPDEHPASVLPCRDFVADSRASASWPAAALCGS